MDAEERSDGSVGVRLTKPEALVLFDWLHRLEEEDISLARMGFVDKAEQRVIWDLSAMLETVVVEAFQADYQEKVDAAREQIRSDRA